MIEKMISVIVPVYNAERTLDRCVSALIGQTYDNIEIILVNDGSRDDSLELCRRFAVEDTRIKVIDKPNGGVSSARNAGLDAASGEFIMFCDSDDWVESDWCEKMYAVFSPQDLIMCGYLTHYGDGRSDKVSCTQKVFCKSEYLRLQHIGGFAPWNKIYSADIIRKNRVRFPLGVSLGEDKLFIWRYLKCIEGRIRHVNIPLNHYVVSKGTSLSTTLPRDYYYQCILILSEITEDISNGMNCSSEAWAAFAKDSYYQIESALAQVLRERQFSVAEKRRVCQYVMNAECVRRITASRDTRITSKSRLFVRYKSFWGLYLMHLLKKI